MSFRSIELPAQVPGRLWLDSMPGRFGAWNNFEQESRSRALNLVVCLTPLQEVQELSPRYHEAIVRGGAPWRWMHLPASNFGVPSDATAFRHSIVRVAQALGRGESVLMHCAAGIGRTGSAAACVLKALGLSTQEALQRVRAAGSNPQNAEQSGFVDWF